MDSITEISYYLNKCQMLLNALLMTTLSISKTVHLTFSAVQLLQWKTFNFLSLALWPRNSPELNSTVQNIYKTE